MRKNYPVGRKGDPPTGDLTELEAGRPRQHPFLLSGELPDFKAQVNSRTVQQQVEDRVPEQQHGSRTVQQQVLDEVPSAAGVLVAELTNDQPLVAPRQEQIEPQGAPHEDEITCHVKKHNLYWILGLLVLLVVLLGGLCGSGNCGSQSSNSSASVDSDALSNATAGPTPFESSTAIPTDGLATNTPATTRGGAITAYINSITLSDTTVGYPVAAATATPEERALEWIIEEDPLQLTAETAFDQFRLRQRYALLTLWFQSPNIPWTDSTNWLDADECGWYGITCVQEDLDGDVGSKYTVSEVDMDPGYGNSFESDADPGYGNYLHGRIPADLGLLSSLRKFEVDDNELTGTLPQSLSRWNQLEEFRVQGNALTGTLPNSIGQWWPSLTVFNVRINRLTGTIPDSVGSWKKLNAFMAWTNFLEGPLPESIGQWTKLTTFWVANNNLSGTIPESIENWSQIESAHFEKNAFVGTMPSGICQFINTSTALPSYERDSLGADCDFIECSCCTVCS